MAELPDTRHLQELLAPWAGKTAFVVPMTDREGRLLGNNGDRLMHAVFRCLLNEFNISVTANGAGADLVIVPPNGALLEVYSFPQILAERLRGLEDVPVVIFPSSALFPVTDPAFIFAGRRSPTLWLLREQYSHHHLQSKWGASLAKAGVTLVLDHDVVASGHAYVSRILDGKIACGHVLIASRIDLEARDILAQGESEAGGKGFQRALASIMRVIVPYGRTRTFIERMARFRERQALAVRMIDLMPSDVSRSLRQGGLTVVSVDASLPNFATFDEYSRLIRGASCVITNRLHVALPATALGKRVFLVDSGYHKLRGVYERSLSRAGNIQLIASSKHELV